MKNPIICSLAILLLMLEVQSLCGALLLISGTRQRKWLCLKSDDSADEETCARRREILLSTTGVAAFAVSSQCFEPTQASAAASGSTRSSSPLSAAFFDPVIPFSSRRQYRQLTVASNGLRVLLVSDKEAFRASAALSIQDAGQFSEPRDVPGLAHLLEHMVLSSSTKGKLFRKEERDFEDWLADNEGASNAFTAPGLVCFHFSSPQQVFAEALERFAALLEQEAVHEICRNEETLKREIRRVDAELDYSDDVTQAFYLSKEVINPEHPFSRFEAGNLESLENNPKREGIDVGTALADFFDSKYLSSRAVLVAVCPADLFTMERWIAPFANTLSLKHNGHSEKLVDTTVLPEPFPIRSKLAQVVLYRSKADSVLKQETEKLSFEWPLQIDYAGRRREGLQVIGAAAVGCIITQILARRGPGSLYLFLLRRGWVRKGNQGLPRITFPVDVSGFQMMKLEIGLTLNGFANRSAVIAAVYDSIRKISRIGQPPKSFLLPRELFNQYVTVARLHGYALASRPPDAVELAVDAQMYGLSATTGVGSLAGWPILPSTDDTAALSDLRQTVADTLEIMNDPTRVIILVTASSKAIETSSFVDGTLPPVSSPRWETQLSTGGRYLVESGTSKFPGYVEAWVTAKLDEDELLPPVVNPLIPPAIRPPRPVVERLTSDGGRRVFYRDRPGDTVWREFIIQAPDRLQETSSWEDRTLSSLDVPNWRLWLSPGTSSSFPQLSLPVAPTEPTPRAGVVLQLISPRPARANVRQAAAAQLWMMSFHSIISDLAELGAPAGLAYETSFNKFGLRISFLGISQNLPSYVRRLCRRLVQHDRRILQGYSDAVNPAVVESAVIDANRAISLSPFRKRQLVTAIRDTSSAQVATEGSSFLKSCNGGIFLAQGDLLPIEAEKLMIEVQGIFDFDTDARLGTEAAIPTADEMLYKPFWRPRGASICLLPGIPLVSDPCGRIQR